MGQWRLADSGGKTVAELLGLNRKNTLVRVDSIHGSFTVKVDGRGAFLCPVCGSVRLYSVKDLIYHISFHARYKNLLKE